MKSEPRENGTISAMVLAGSCFAEEGEERARARAREKTELSGATSDVSRS